MAKKKHKKTKAHLKHRHSKKNRMSSYAKASEDKEDKHEFSHTKIEEETPEVEDQKDMDEQEVKEQEEKEKSKKKHKETKKESKHRIDSELTAIYADTNGDIPDMHTFVKRKQRSLSTAIIVLVAAAVFLGGVSWLGFTVLKPTSKFSEEDVVLTMSGNDEIKAGELQSYRIRYRNAQNVGISNAKLEVRFPKSFQFVTSSIPASNEQNDTWDLSTVDPQDSGYIDVEGRIYGSMDSEHSFRLFLNYQPDNFSDDFQKVTQFTTKVTESPIRIGVEGPTDARVGGDTEFNVEVQLDVDDTTLPEDVHMEVFGDFTLSNSDPKIEDDRTWKLQQIKENEFNLVGSFSKPDEGDVGTLGVRIFTMYNDERIVVAEYEHSVALTENEIRSSLIVNGVSDAVGIRPGEVVNASITLENITEDVLKDVRVRMNFDAPSYNKLSILYWAQIDDVYDGDIVGEQLSDDMRRGEIEWDKSHIEDFASLQPGEKVIIDVRIPVKTINQTTLSEYATYTGVIDYDVRYTAGDNTQVVDGSAVNMSFNSDVELDVRSKHSDNEYELTWVLTNTFHDLKDIELSVDIFGDVTFDPGSVNAPAGSIEYDEESQKMTWSIKNMPTSIDVLALQFDVSLNDVDPSQKNVMSRVRGKAIDAITGEEITIVGEEVLVQ